MTDQTEKKPLPPRISLVLSNSRWLRFLVFFSYYFMQGLPQGLVVIALPAWFIEMDMPIEMVASFSAIVFLPWSLKLVIGPFMDRFSFLPMGMRRPWILGAQFMLMLTAAMFFFVGDPLDHFWLMTGICTAMNIFAASEDVAVDGLAIGIIPENERGRANAFMGAGTISGMSISGGVAIGLLKSGGFPAVGVYFVGVLWVLILITIVVRERPGERLLTLDQW